MQFLGENECSQQIILRIYKVINDKENKQTTIMSVHHTWVACKYKQLVCLERQRFSVCPWRTEFSFPYLHSPVVRLHCKSIDPTVLQLQD